MRSRVRTRTHGSVRGRHPCFRRVPSYSMRALSDSEEKPPWRAAKANEGGPEEASRKVASEGRAKIEP